MAKYTRERAIKLLGQPGGVSASQWENIYRTTRVALIRHDLVEHDTFGDIKLSSKGREKFKKELE